MQVIPAQSSTCKLSDVRRVSRLDRNSLGARDSVVLKSSNDSKALHLDRIIALAAGAIVMAHLNEVLAGNEISADQRIGIDAGIVVLGN